MPSTITDHTKKKENLNSNEKMWSTDTTTEKTQILQFSNVFQAAVIKMLQQAIMNTQEANLKIAYLNNKIDDIKKNQIKILELKNTVDKKFKKLTGWVSWQNWNKKRLSELEDRLIEII